MGGIAGCLGSTPPAPRRSTVFEDVSARDGTIAVSLESDPWVESRKDLGSSGDVAASGGLLPVGRAEAAKGGGGGGTGAVGRGSSTKWSSAPSHNGHAVYHGRRDDDWREENSEEISRYDARIKNVGIAYIGGPGDDEDNLPGVKKPDWDQTWTVSAGESVTLDSVRPGWYRVGSQLQAEEYDQSFNWEYLDFEVEKEGDGFEVEEPWKVSPRL